MIMASLEAWTLVIFGILFLVVDVMYIREMPLLDHRLELYWRGRVYRPHLGTITAVFLGILGIIGVIFALIMAIWPYEAT